VNLYAAMCGAAAVLVPVGLVGTLADPQSAPAWGLLVLGVVLVGCIVPLGDEADS
jgi:hypothetical protein